VGRRHTWFALVGALALGSPASACEPIVPLTQLLAGGTLAGPALLTQSALWIGLAVALKCGAFAFLERRLLWQRAIIVMLLANVVSTIPGILVSAFAGSGTGLGFILSLPVVFLLGWLVQRRLALLPKTGRRSWASGGWAALAFTGCFIVSAGLFALAQVALDGNKFVAYWLLKFLFVTAAAAAGIVLSAVMEECVIAWLARRSNASQSFYASVFRANYITLGAVLLVAAVRMLPARLNSPHFITSWLDSVLAAIGPA
jgi:hypothetical protein